jgi:hypothetical protein
MYQTEWFKKTLVQKNPKILCHLNREQDRDTNCKTVAKVYKEKGKNGKIKEHCQVGPSQVAWKP